MGFTGRPLTTASGSNSLRLNILNDVVLSVAQGLRCKLRQVGGHLDTRPTIDERAAGQLLVE